MAVLLELVWHWEADPLRRSAIGALTLASLCAPSMHRGRLLGHQRMGSEETSDEGRTGTVCISKALSLSCSLQSRYSKGESTKSA